MMILNQAEYSSIKEPTVQGRYVVHGQIEEYLKNGGKICNVQTLGNSVLGLPIRSVSLGSGSNKVLIWSQMHGNESTTTKALLDLMNYLNSDLPEAKAILKNCTVAIIPMLNPDGAQAYTRTNANAIDLNRDAKARTQPEIRVLHAFFDEFNPDYCFNMHDQRTLFNVGNTPAPATVSFLAPACDEARTISPSRELSMQLIVAMNEMLQTEIPGQVGRYDDAFNENCVGDTFQMTGTPTVLFEAGHYREDYGRERTRAYIFQSMITALNSIGYHLVSKMDASKYFDIPENQKHYYDILITNAYLMVPSLAQGDAIGISFEETLMDSTIHFVPIIKEVGILNEFFGHITYNCLIDSDLTMLNRNGALLELMDSF